MKNLFIGFLLALTPLITNAGHVEIALGNNQLRTQESLYHNFGRIWTNSRSSVRYTVTNTGDQPLTFQRATISGSAFDASHNCAKGLLPKQKCSFTINFWPAFEGLYSGRFALNFVEDQIIVNLWGEAYKM